MLLIGRSASPSGPERAYLANHSAFQMAGCVNAKTRPPEAPAQASTRIFNALVHRHVQLLPCSLKLLYTIC